MRRQVLILLLAFFFTRISFGQDVMNDIAKTYFRSNPFSMDFGKFIDHLIHDPSLVKKDIAKRTDTSFFYFSGQYSNHNPFLFKSLRTEIMLTEVTEQMPDSTRRLDTFFVYQLRAYTLGDKEGLDDVKKEYAKFDRKF